MSNELSWRHSATGETLYATIRSAARTMWNGSALEALTVANWGTYDIPLEETPAAGYFHVGNWPAALATPGWYWVDIFLQDGSDPDISDVFQGTIYGYWDGTKFEPAGGDTKQHNGTAQTARDIGASVLISPGSGAGQLDVTSGVVKANLAQILGTALTETAGYLAAGFKKFFNIETPVATVASINQTGDSFARLGNPAGASIAADIASIPAAVWAVSVRTLSSFGTLVADAAAAVWASVARTITDKTGFSLSSAYDPAKTAAQASVTATEANVNAVGAAVLAVGVDTDSLLVTVELIRLLAQNRLEFDLVNSVAYKHNDAGVRAYISTLSDSDGNPVTDETTGPINMTKWVAV